VITLDIKGDFVALASRIEDIIAWKIDTIVLDSADLNQLKDQIKKSNKAGIPVLDVDAVWIPGGTVLRFVLWWRWERREVFPILILCTNSKSTISTLWKTERYIWTYFNVIQNYIHPEIFIQKEKIGVG
jgi:hypothetical protein